MRRDSTLFEKCIERVSVGAEVAEMLSGATLGLTLSEANKTR